jgi:hypothetical protein
LSVEVEHVDIGAFYSLLLPLFRLEEIGFYWLILRLHILARQIFLFLVSSQLLFYLQLNFLEHFDLPLSIRSLLTFFALIDETANSNIRNSASIAEECATMGEICWVGNHLREFSFHLFVT